MEYIVLPSFNTAVVASGRLTMNLDHLDGYAIHFIEIKMTGTTFDRSHLDDIGLAVNTKDLLGNISGAQLQRINGWDGLPTDAAYMMLYLGDPTAETPFGQHLTDLDFTLYPAHKTTLDIKLGAGISGDADIEVRAYGVRGGKAAMGLGYTQAQAAMTRAILNTQLTPPNAVTKKSYQISLGSNAGAAIRKLMFDSVLVTSVETKKSGSTKWDDIAQAEADFVGKIFNRVPQANTYVLDYVVDGNQAKVERTVDAKGRPYPMQVNVTTSAGGTIPCFADLRVAVALL